MKHMDIFGKQKKNTTKKNIYEGKFLNPEEDIKILHEDFTK